MSLDDLGEHHPQVANLSRQTRREETAVVAGRRCEPPGLAEGPFFFFKERLRVFFPEPDVTAFLVAAEAEKELAVGEVGQSKLAGNDDIVLLKD